MWFDIVSSAVQLRGNCAKIAVLWIQRSVCENVVSEVHGDTCSSALSQTDPVTIPARLQIDLFKL